MVLPVGRMGMLPGFRPGEHDHRLDRELGNRLAPEELPELLEEES